MGDFDLVSGLMWYFVFVYSVVLHEAGHAWAALKLGDDTAYRGGQVSIDPTPHIAREPFGMVIVPVLTWFLYGGAWMLGWGSAPVDAQWAGAHPRRSALVSMAGPAATLLIVLGALVALRAGLAFGVFAMPETFSFTHLAVGADGKLWDFLAMLLSLAFGLNLILFFFNLLPVPPLDGSALPMFFMKDETAAQYQEMISSPMLALCAMLIVWNVFAQAVPAIHRVAVWMVFGL